MLQLTLSRTDHILSTFAEVLRDHATKDRLLTISGVSGGVSGYVQSVLVPELALSLIREDLGPNNGQNALSVIAESTELGELLNPEMEDNISGR